jgi:hypothetical protein
MKSILTAAALAVLLAGGAQASSLLFSQTLTPTSGDGDTKFFDDDNDFNESFDFSAVAYDSIDRFELTLVASASADESRRVCFFLCATIGEDWDIRVQGSDGSGSGDDLFDDIADGSNPYTIDAASDGGGVDVFANAVATGLFTVWLSENSSDMILDNPSITVSSLRLDVYGTAPSVVPLPAGAPLLLAGLAGFAALRRRGRRAA